MTLQHSRRRSGEAGFTLIDVLFVIAIIGMLSSLAVPSLLRARGAAQAGSALGTLRVIGSAEVSFAITCGSGFYATDLPSLGMPPSGTTVAFLTDELTAAPTVVKSGYTFSLAGMPSDAAPATCSGLGAGTSSGAYAAVADPIDPSQNPRFFGTNSDGLIYEDSVSIAGDMPAVGPPPHGVALR